MKQIVICCGINRSGSTWSYQVVKHLLSSYSVQDLGFITEIDHDTRTTLLNDKSKFVLLKMHKYDSALEEIAKTIPIKLIYTHRDLRGIVYSLMLKTKKSFDEIIGMPFLSASIASQSNWDALSSILYISYNEIVFESKKSVNKLSMFLDLKLDSDEVDIINKLYTRDSQVKRINKSKHTVVGFIKNLFLKVGVNLNTQDEKSLLHLNHINSNDPDEWKNFLTAFQAEEVYKQNKEWMSTFNYK